MRSWWLPPRSTALANALAQLGVHVAPYAASQRLEMCDADGMLRTFMKGDLPDPKRFTESLERAIAKVKPATDGASQGLTVFGEMVAVLWERGNKNGALNLEAIWNRALEERAFHLHCAYPQSFFKLDNLSVRNICDSHSHVFGALTPQTA